MTKPDWTTKEFREAILAAGERNFGCLPEELQVDIGLRHYDRRPVVHLVPVKETKIEALWKRLGKLKGFEERNK